MSRARVLLAASSIVFALAMRAEAQTPLYGWFEYADENFAGGWAYAPGLGHTPLRIQIFSGTTLLATGIADFARPDLPPWFLGRRHGFRIPLPALAPGSHALRAFALDEGGAPRLLGERTVQAT